MTAHRIGDRVKAGEVVGQIGCGPWLRRDPVCWWDFPPAVRG
jgi:hypothetical protein